MEVINTTSILKCYDYRSFDQDDYSYLDVKEECMIPNRTVIYGQL